MKQSSTIFLQVVLVLIAIGAITLLLWEPHLEGVNAHATTLSAVYFDDPFLAYVYIASLPFFLALYQAFKLLTYIGRNEVFSQAAVKALRNIKYCAFALVVFVGAPVAHLFIARPGDDIAGGVVVGLFIMFGSVVIVAAAAVFEKMLQSAVDIKSENDLTV